MPKLPAVKPREVARFLQQHGFLLDRVAGSHFIYYHPTTKRRAVVPRHNRDIPKALFFLCCEKPDSPGKI